MTDWNSAVEANAALDRGELPPDYTLRDDGALITPPGSGDRLRGHSSITARFDTIIAPDGRVLKSKAGFA